MSAIKRFFWLVTLVTFSGGCSSYRMVTSPRIEDERETAAGWGSSIKVGDEVRITLADKRRAEGRIMAISFESLTLEPKYYTNYTKYPENLTGEYLPRVIVADSIGVIEVQKRSLAKTVLLVTGILAGSAGIIWTSDFSFDIMPDPNEHWRPGK